MENELLRLCTERGALRGMMLETEDITEQWKILAPEYMADAVPEIANYPTVSVSWAAYLGLAVAYGWDADWETFLKIPYQSYYGEQGFDDMDEHIVRDLLRMPLDSRSAKELENTIRYDWTTEVELTNEKGEVWAVPLADLRGYQSDPQSVKWSEVYYSEDGKCAWVQHSTGTTYRAEVVKV